MRILITTRFYRNGQTSHVLSLCTELMRQGHEIFLIITYLDCPNYISWLNEQGISYSKKSDPLKLIARFQTWQPDLIHNHSVQTLELSTQLSKTLQIPCLTTIHYLDFNAIQGLNSQDAIIVISKEMHSKFRKKLRPPIFVVENGVLIASQNQIMGKQFTKKALFLAQVTKGKEQNFEDMAQALQAWDWELFSAGNWRYPGVKHLGWVTNIWPFLDGVDLVIGTGRAVREGMAAKCATWILGDYSDGLVTPRNVRRFQYRNFSGRTSKKPFNRLQAAKILENPDPRRFRDLGDFGRKYAQKNFSITAMVAKLCQIYHYVLENTTSNKRSKTGKI